MRRLVLLSAVLAGWMASGGAVADDGPRPFTDSLARAFSADVRAADERLWEIRRELAMLPDLRQARQVPRYGFQSRPVFEPDDPQWLLLDLREPRRIDGIVLAPVDLSAPSVSEEGYGFPRRFKVEAGMMDDMSDAMVIVDETSRDVPNPERSALVYHFESLEAQFIRVTSTKHWPTVNGDHYLWALGELMVISGNYNVAPVAARASSSSVEVLPSWSMQAVNDGHSILELPVSMRRSPSHGYLSEVSTDPDDEKWVKVDLGEVCEVDEVRLIPARPRGFTGPMGRGFPEQITLELSEDPEFLENVRRVASKRATTPPWNNGVLFQGGGKPARYVRVEAQGLAGGGGAYAFGMAEMQVYSKGENVALGKSVIVSDAARPEDHLGWAPEYLVDGFSSRRQLVEWPEYLASLERRRALEEERDELQVRRDGRAHRVAINSMATGSGLAGASLLGLTVLLVRQNTARKRDVTRLREQIARDLHDDLGSNLGSISLLGELGSRLESLPEDVRRDFQEIHDTAERSAEAMRDIVWLIDSGSTSLPELIAKMRETADRMFSGLAKVKVDPEQVAGRELSLLFRRHVFFAFKEALNNVRKHAGASEVRARIEATSQRLTFEVCDDGEGFEMAALNGLGRGLRNFERRAARLRGSCLVESQIGRGTTVRFEVPLRYSGNGSIR